MNFKELCPFPRDQIKQEIEKYSQAKEFVWCQEEPQNAGAYAFMAPRLAQLVPQKEIQYVGRGPLSAPAVGNPPRFRAEQSKLVEDALQI
ncbi:putative 2-oxoglutarate dehydrogenase E1 component DHKTD1, mitochondrial [Apophysomyces sp. BC1034]|nr:putative 2-oxoglutarate dehydrogenase E1 component DHKTD1, mitochondrial [Apophysomyces sp. BC1034]